MTNTYHVHLYRAMRLTFSPVKANSPDESAEIARNLASDEAVSIDDCDGEHLAALVDVVGDEEFEQSVLIDFDSERARKAVPALLAALQAFLSANELAEECGEWKWENLEHAFALARDAVAKAVA